MEEWKKKLSLYKPNKRLSGSAVQLDFNKEKQSVFLEAAMQVEEQKFNWNEKIIFKLNDVDLAKMLTVMEGKAKGIELFHDPTKARAETEKKNATLSFFKGDYGYFLKVTTQGFDGSLKSVGISISEEEAVMLRIAFQKAIEEIVGW